MEEIGHTLALAVWGNQGATVVQIEPAVRGLCRQLPALRDSQQRLAADLPQFKPYATLEADDIDDCEADVRNEFAIR